MASTLRQRAYDYIRRKLLSGELPPGARLSNRALAAEIGISFIPIREAISELASEGLVDHQPGIGSFVLRPSRQEIADLYDIREALECHAVTRAAVRITAEDLVELERENEVLQEAAKISRDGQGWTTEIVDRCLRADANLHVTLLRSAGNARLMQLVDDLRIMAQLFTASWKFTHPVEDLGRTYDEHATMIAALRNRDSDTARQVLARHIRASCQEAIEAFESLEPSPAKSEGSS